VFIHWQIISECSNYFQEFWFLPLYGVDAFLGNSVYMDPFPIYSFLKLGVVPELTLLCDKFGNHSSDGWRFTEEVWVQSQLTLSEIHGG
jgi:hypothetical protein